MVLPKERCYGFHPAPSTGPGVVKFSSMVS